VAAILEILRVVLGVWFGIMALSFLWVTVRSWTSGRAAFEANRMVTYPSIRKTAAGQLRPPHKSSESRANDGLAIDLRSRKLVPQQRLSDESVDDVIGRRI